MCTQTAKAFHAKTITDDDLLSTQGVTPSTWVNTSHTKAPFELKGRNTSWVNVRWRLRILFNLKRLITAFWYGLTWMRLYVMHADLPHHVWCCATGRITSIYSTSSADSFKMDSSGLRQHTSLRLSFRDVTTKCPPRLDSRAGVTVYSVLL